MIDLRLGSCLAPDGLAALADGSIDITISDPPFDARTHRGALAKPRNRGAALEPLPFAALDDEQVAEVAHHLARVTRRWVLIFAADRQLELWAQALELGGARVDRFGIARRLNPKPQFSGDRPGQAADLIVIAHGAAVKRYWNGGGRPAIWDSPAVRFDEGGQVHPTQKPMSLMRAVVSDFTAPGELVLDPFAGAGSTAVACKELGRRFMGWELDAGYHGAAMRRIEGAREQLRLEVGAPGEQRALGF
jgi:hypothetical protein